MIVIQGHWYSGQQSAQQAVSVIIDSYGMVSVYERESPGIPMQGQPFSSLFSGELKQLSISSRLGNSTRSIYFPGGQKFETRDNERVDQAIAMFSPRPLATLIHYLESRWHIVLVVTLLLLACGYWVAVYGVPLTAKTVAAALPESLVKNAGKETLSLLDQQFLSPSTLDDSTQQQVRDHFSSIIEAHQDYQLTLLFRDSDLGANAFALPDGTIIFTDDIVRLADNNDELLAVMAHEIGHVVHNHSMRAVVQGSLLGFIAMLISGDASAASELLLGIPVLLTQLGYSREFEREADDYAHHYMVEHDIELEHFSHLMARIQQNYQSCDSDSDNANGGQETACDSDSDWQVYISTHPALQERLKKFNEKR